VGPDQLFAFFARAGAGGLDVLKRLRHLAMAGPMIRDPQTGRVRVGGDGDMAFTYDLTDQHLDAFRAGMALGARAYFAAGATKVAFAIGDLEFYTSEADALRAVDAVRSPDDLLAVYGSHPQGTCRMGASPDKAVVDGNGRVHGTENVYVMDGSIFPTTLGVNPQLTIMSLALALSRRLTA
jgi:choline dehydrogenase-like flavoprotein